MLEASINQAAKDWGVNLSTLKNYFSRQSSTPRHEVLLKISSCEGVSVDWLLYEDLTKSDNELKLEGKNPLYKVEMLSSSALKLALIIDMLDKQLS